MMLRVWIYKIRGVVSKTWSGQSTRGKSQSQDFIGKLHGLGHTFAQMVSLACWYPPSVTDRVSGRSSLLLSVLQIVDSRPLWILVSVLEELHSTFKDCRCPTGLFERVTWLKYPVLCLLIIPGVQVHLSWVVGESPLFGLSPCLFLVRFVSWLCSICVSLLHCWLCSSSFPMPKKVCM